MSQMTKHYQGVRARKMLNILKSHEENNQPAATVSCNPDTLDQETQEIRTLRCNDYQTNKQKCNITRSNSFSNITKGNSFMTRRCRRCSSLPPTITVHYERPSDYITVTKEARVNPYPYEAVQINFDFVKNYNDKTNWRYSTIRPGRKAGDPVVVDLRAIQYRPDGTIYYKINFDDDWTELPVRPRKLNSVAYSPLHVAPIPIASTKFNHLQQLKEVLPKDCHLFYDNLSHE